jgi:hypothetical protein
MEIIENPPISASLQALVREFGNSLIVDSSLFLKNENFEENIDKVISKLEKYCSRLREIEIKNLNQENSD